MAKYLAKTKLWLSHECRAVEEGETFETEFPPGPGGKAMVLGANIELVEEDEKPLTAKQIAALAVKAEAGAKEAAKKAAADAKANAALIAGGSDSLA